MMNLCKHGPSPTLLTVSSFSPVGTTTPFHSSGLINVPSMLKVHQQPYSAPHNALDSTAPRIKRGKEREIPKVKRPTALKKVGDFSWAYRFRRGGRMMILRCFVRSLVFLPSVLYFFSRSSWRNVKGRKGRRVWNKRPQARRNTEMSVYVLLMILHKSLPPKKVRPIHYQDTSNLYIFLIH